MLRLADHFVFGTMVVAALLWFTALVALFRHDLGDPIVASLTFALAGLGVWLAGRVLAAAARRSRGGSAPS